VAEKYLMIHPVDLGSIVYDRHLNGLITEMKSLTGLNQSSDAFTNVYQIAMKLVSER
jgi:hypothetical protein